jgi:hypothetical protein
MSPKCASAESAIHFCRDLVSIIGASFSLISIGIIFGRVNPCGIEARFQRLMYQQSNTWGDAPG